MFVTYDVFLLSSLTVCKHSVVRGIYLLTKERKIKYALYAKMISMKMLTFLKVPAAMAVLFCIYIYSFSRLFIQNDLQMRNRLQQAILRVRNSCESVKQH